MYRFGGNRSFLYQRRVLLRDLIHWRDGLVYLVDAGGLFLAGLSRFLRIAV